MHQLQIPTDQSNISARLNLVASSINQSTNNVNYNLNIGSQQVNYSSENISQIQGQNMSQAAQIVLLPTQNIITNVPKQEQQVQMILPNEVGYQIAFPNVSVLVPTTILITDKNECILIPQNSQNICQNLPLVSTSTQMNTSSTDSSYGANADYEDNCRRQFTQEQECEFITLANTGTQTVIAGIPENEVNQTQLISNNCQIVGIIGTNQIEILQNEPNSENQVLLTACIDTGENVNQVNLVSQSETTDYYDVNAFLASTIASGTVEKSDPNQAKEWLKDSCIVNRALKALKKANHRSHNRPHQQIWR